MYQQWITWCVRLSFIYFERNNIFIQEGHIKQIKSKDIYIVTKDLYFKYTLYCLFLSFKKKKKKTLRLTKVSFYSWYWYVKEYSWFPSFFCNNYTIIMQSNYNEVRCEQNSYRVENWRKVPLRQVCSLGGHICNAPRQLFPAMEVQI